MFYKMYLYTCVIMSTDLIFIFQTNGDKNIYSGSVYKQTYTCICPYIYTLYINIVALIIEYKHEDSGI